MCGFGDAAAFPLAPSRSEGGPEVGVDSAAKPRLERRAGLPTEHLECA